MDIALKKKFVFALIRKFFSAEISEVSNKSGL
jgi:hypothetical protein